MADTPGSINVEKTVSSMRTWGHILWEKYGLKEVCCELSCYLIDHFVCEVLSRVFTRCSRSSVLIRYDDWWLSCEECSHRPQWIMLNLSAITAPSHSSESREHTIIKELLLLRSVPTKRMSVGKSESVNNVLEPESIVVPVNTMWSLSYFCYIQNARLHSSWEH